MAKTIGIDLGTTFSAVSFLEAGKAQIITNAEGERTTPSVVSIKDGERIVGRTAKNQSIVNPKNTIRSIKRYMGDAKHKVDVDGKEFTPQEISAIILQKLKRDAESFLGTEVKDVVITVPAYFNDSQRQATKDAGKIAGLNVQRIINEPTAAALAYGLDKAEDQTILVFDFGGGTFDVSILELGDGVFEVKSTSGDNFLGGDDVDQVIIDWLASDFKKNEGVDLLKDPTAHQRLKEAAEKAKIELSSKLKVDINIPYVTADASGPKHINTELSRAKFEDMIQDIIKKLEGPTKQALKDAGLDTVDKVILVGGSTRIPAVQELVKKIIGKEPDKSINPDEAVAMGAAIQAGVLSGDVKDVLLLDVTPLTLGIETLGGVFTPIIEKNTTIPSKKSQVFSTAADNQNAVTIRVFQGERSIAEHNKILGQFDLVGIPPAPRGVPQIEVTFDIDANGIVNVSAKDKGTNKETSIKITGSGNLSDDEVEAMVKAAKENEEADKKAQETIELKNQAENLVYQGKKTLDELKDKIDDDTKKKVEDATKELEEAQQGDDLDKLKEKVEEFNKIIQEIGAKVYQDAQAAQGAAGADPNAAGAESAGADAKGKDGEKVVDAEFEESEDKDSSKDDADKKKKE